MDFSFSRPAMQLALLTIVDTTVYSREYIKISINDCRRGWGCDKWILRVTTTMTFIH
jgi:hypothetical protein